MITQFAGAAVVGQRSAQTLTCPCRIDRIPAVSAHAQVRFQRVTYQRLFFASHAMMMEGNDGLVALEIRILVLFIVCDSVPID